jgi:hypothetical protein
VVGCKNSDANNLSGKNFLILDPAPGGSNTAENFQEVGYRLRKGGNGYYCYIC